MFNLNSIKQSNILLNSLSQQEKSGLLGAQAIRLQAIPDGVYNTQDPMYLSFTSDCRTLVREIVGKNITLLPAVSTREGQTIAQGTYREIGTSSLTRSVVNTEGQETSPLTIAAEYGYEETDVALLYNQLAGKTVEEFGETVAGKNYLLIEKRSVPLIMGGAPMTRSDGAPIMASILVLVEVANIPATHKTIKVEDRRWIIPENKLDAQQRDFLDNRDISKRNIWIKGFAGSGKSVLLAYTAKKILSRAPSSKVLLIVFTRSLVEMFTAVNTYYAFMDEDPRSYYDYILCDEVQDLTPRVLREMNARSSHVVVAGDSNQSIYTKDPRWQELTVTPSEIGSLINGDSFELSIIHRLSRSIIDAVQRFLPRMNIFSAKSDMTKSDTQIRLCEASSELEEVSYVMEQATKAVNQGYTAAVLIPKRAKIIQFANQALTDAGKSEWKVTPNPYGNPDFDALNAHLKRNGIKMQYLGSGYGKLAKSDNLISLMTFHSAKGLDFDNVFIPYANSRMCVSADESLAKTLFMVAMTRAKENLYITFYGYPSDYLDAFASNCSHIDISSAQTPRAASPGSNTWGF